MGVITTSIVVNFGQEDQGILTAEIDDREDGYNDGDTNFQPGDTAAFLIYKTSNVDVNTPVVSLGAVTQISGPENITKDEFITFEDEKSATTALPVYGNFTYKWIGTDLGTVTVSNQQDLTSANKGVAVLKVTYTSQFTPWRLTNVPTSYDGETTFPVLIFVSGVVS